MWTPIGRSIVNTNRSIRANVLLLLWIGIVSIGVSARWHPETNLSKNNTTFIGTSGFTQKKPRSAQYGGFIPRLQTVYPRQSVPVRLATIPVNSGGYRLPMGQKFANVAPLAQLPGFQRAYVPVISALPSMRYPVLRQGGLTGRYVVPYALKMPAQTLPTAPQVNEDLGKHFNQKYNTLPTISNMDLTQDGLNVPRKSESKNLDIGDDFDNFLASLGGFQFFLCFNFINVMFWFYTLYEMGLNKRVYLCRT